MTQCKITTKVRKLIGSIELPYGTSIIRRRLTNGIRLDIQTNTPYINEDEIQNSLRRILSNYIVKELNNSYFIVSENVKIELGSKNQFSHTNLIYVEVNGVYETYTKEATIELINKIFDEED